MLAFLRYGNSLSFSLLREFIQVAVNSIHSLYMCGIEGIYPDIHSLVYLLCNNSTVASMDTAAVETVVLYCK